MFVLHRHQLADSLWKAVSNKDEQQVKLCLEKGAKPDHQVFFENESYESRPTPLGMACVKSNLPIVKLLIENGANPNRNSLMFFQEAPLHLACVLKNNLDIVKYLVGEARCNVGKSLSYPNLNLSVGLFVYLRFMDCLVTSF